MKDNKAADKWRDEGNSLYQQKQYRDAVVAYNKSLCYSEPGSKQLALAYGNRSAVFLEVELHDECLENIQLARENNHPDPLKLNAREEKCLEAREKHIKDPENDPAELIKLSYEPNKKLPFIVDCLELRENEQFGRHFVTTRDLHPGDIISIEEPLLKTIESIEPRYERCIFCLETKKHNLIPCDGCSITMFCSESCTPEPMKKFHKAECDLFQQNVQPNELNRSFKYTTAMRFFFESMELAGSSEELASLMTQTDPVSMYDFDFSENSCKTLDWNRLKIISGFLTSNKPEFIERYKNIVKIVEDHILTTENPETVSNYLVHLLLIFDRNGWNFLNRNGTAPGNSALYFIASMMNHSCSPNTNSTLFGAKQVHFVIKPIKKNEQLFGKYREFIPNRDERRADLLKRFNFLCSCPACVNDYPPGKQIPPCDPNFKAWFASIDSVLYRKSDWKSKVDKLSNYIEKKFEFYPLSEIQYCEDKIAFLLQKASDLQDWPFH